MPCKAPPFARKADCPGPGGAPAHLRCQRCARGLCEAPGDKFDANCEGPDAADGRPKCRVCAHRGQLSARRGSVANLRALGNTGQQLQQAWTDRVETIVENLWNDAVLQAGAPGVNYAFCFAGSLARNEASPYSDLDSFIIVEDDSPAVVQRFIAVCEVIKEIFSGAEGNWGLRFCNIMSPFGDSTNPKAPKLIRTPVNMAHLMELPPAQIEGHITAGLQEYKFGFGDHQLFQDFKTEMDTVLGANCWKRNSRPVLARGKRVGLEVIQDVVRNPKFQPPNKTDATFHVKEQFYRPPQFIAKGLAWYYGIDRVSTSDQLAGLVQAGHMSNTVANNFRVVMDVMAKLRFKLHLDREGEKDFVYTDVNARNNEIQQLEAILNRNEDQKERLNRLKGGTHLTRAEIQDLIGCISNLNFIMRLAREFVAQKTKVIGKRKNPFAG